jgi:hypothetical protein
VLPVDDPLELEPVLCQAPGCPRLPARGRVLCTTHGAELGQWLAELRTDLAALNPAPVSGGISADDLNRGRTATKVKSRGTPVNLDVLTLTDRRIAWLTDDDLDDLVDPVGRDSTPRALEVLAWWAGLVRAGRGLTPPTRTLPGLPPASLPGPACASAGPPVEVPAPLTVTVERQLLVEHLDWCLRQSWAGAMWRSIRELWAAVKSARGEDVARPVARCRRPSTVELGAVCAGAVWSERGAGWCGRCGHVWTGRELLELTRKGVAA